MTREIVLDTETTGLDPAAGHRVVELAALELVNHVPTGESFHEYYDPERPMPEEAFRIHGLSTEFLAEFPPFRAHAERFLAFIADSPLVIHNAAFDMRFLNAELLRLDLDALPPTRAIDTLQLAQRRFPGAANSLDALCRRFAVDNAARTLHGALLGLRAPGRGLPPPHRRPAGQSRPGAARHGHGRSLDPADPARTPAVRSLEP